MTASVKVSGVFKNVVSGSAVKVSGVWKDVTIGYVKVAGVWKEFFQNITFDLSHTASDSGAGTQTASLTFESDGDVIENLITDIGNWVNPASAAPGTYQMRYTLLSGTFDTASMAEGVWRAMTLGWACSISSTGAGSRNTSFTVDIREGAGPVITSGTSSLSTTEI